MDRLNLKTVYFLDLLLIGLSASLGLAFLRGYVAEWPDFWNIDRDWSAGEILNYLKWAALAAVFLTAYLRDRALIMLSLFAVVLILLADDSLQIHETLGPEIVRIFGLHFRFGLAAYTIGPMVIWGALGIAVVALTWFGWRSATAELKRALLPVFGLFFGIVFFAIGVDAMHELIDMPKAMKGVFGIVEDGGEMLMLTAMLIYVWKTFRA